MYLREKARIRNELRDVFGATVPGFDIQRAIYSHQCPECGGDFVKYRQFEQFRADNMLKTYEPQKVNKATYLISTTLENPSFGKEVQSILLSKEVPHNPEAIMNRFNRVFQVR